MLLNQPVTEFTNKEKNKIRAVAYGASSGLIYKQQQISNIFVIADTQEIRIYTIVVSPDTQKYTLVDMDISISTNHHDINQVSRRPTPPTHRPQQPPHTAPAAPHILKFLEGEEEPPSRPPQAHIYAAARNCALFSFLKKPSALLVRGSF